MRLCGKCRVELPEDHFYRQKSGKVLAYCKSCRRTYDAVRKRQGDPVKKSAKLKEWRAQNPDKVQAAQRRARLRRYGLSSSEYEAMLAEQGGHCAVCEATTGASDGLLYVDHNHITGAVRGLLCHNCNTALGHAKDDLDRLMSLAAYLLQDQNVLHGYERDYTA